MNQLVITLDLPDRKLHPNGGKSHSRHAVHRLTRAAQDYAWAETVVALNRATWQHDGAALNYTFHMHNGSTADDDNCIAWMKPYRDGIAKALGIDDKHIRTGRVSLHTDRKKPRVEITIDPEATP